MRSYALHDGETMIVNGALLRMPVGAELVVDNRATVLRGDAIMAAEHASSPARRLYHACLQAYIGHDVVAQQRQIVADLGAVLERQADDAGRATCVRFANAVASGDYVRGLRECLTLMEQEGVPAATIDAMLAD
jgi:flagellar protein FlbT